MGIDPKFYDNRKIVAGTDAYNIWGPPYAPPTKLGIHGTQVAMDMDLCIGDGACIDCCPVDAIRWIDTPGHPTSARKGAPVNEVACIVCGACETSCPVTAIHITDLEAGYYGHGRQPRRDPTWRAEGAFPPVQ